MDVLLDFTSNEPAGKRPRTQEQKRPTSCRATNNREWHFRDGQRLPRDVTNCILAFLDFDDYGVILQLARGACGQELIQSYFQDGLSAVAIFSPRLPPAGVQQRAHTARQLLQYSTNLRRIVYWMPMDESYIDPLRITYLERLIGRHQHCLQAFEPLQCDACQRIRGHVSVDVRIYRALTLCCNTLQILNIGTTRSAKPILNTGGIRMTVAEQSYKEFQDDQVKLDLVRMSTKLQALEVEYMNFNRALGSPVTTELLLSSLPGHLRLTRLSLFNELPIRGVLAMLEQFTDGQLQELLLTHVKVSMSSVDCENPGGLKRRLERQASSLQVLSIHFHFVPADGKMLPLIIRPDETISISSDSVIDFPHLHDLSVFRAADRDMPSVELSHFLDHWSAPELEKFDTNCGLQMAMAALARTTETSRLEALDISSTCDAEDDTLSEELYRFVHHVDETDELASAMLCGVEMLQKHLALPATNLLDSLQYIRLETTMGTVNHLIHHVQRRPTTVLKHLNLVLQIDSPASQSFLRRLLATFPRLQTCSVHMAPRQLFATAAVETGQPKGEEDSKELRMLHLINLSLQGPNFDDQNFRNLHLPVLKSLVLYNTAISESSSRHFAACASRLVIPLSCELALTTTCMREWFQQVVHLFKSERFPAVSIVQLMILFNPHTTFDFVTFFQHKLSILDHLADSNCLERLSLRRMRASTRALPQMLNCLPRFSALTSVDIDYHDTDDDDVFITCMAFNTKYFASSFDWQPKLNTVNVRRHSNAGPGSSRSLVFQRAPAPEGASAIARV
jgi:hypothetical protein